MRKSEWALSPIGLCIWTLGPQLVCRGRAGHWTKYFSGNKFWEVTASPQLQVDLSVLSLQISVKIRHLIFLLCLQAAMSSSLLWNLPLWNCKPKQTLLSCPDYGILSQLQKATNTGLKITNLHRYFLTLSLEKIEYTWEQIRCVLNYIIPKYH